MEKRTTYYFNLSDQEIETIIAALLDSANDMYDQSHIYNNIYNVLWDNILKQINKQYTYPFWNPYPEIKPDKDQHYLVTLDSPVSDNRCVRTAYYNKDYDTWSLNGATVSNVIAFTYLPLSYDPKAAL